MPTAVTGTGLAVGVADALPLGDSAAGDRLGEDQRPLLVGGGLGQRFDGSVAARRHHQRGGERRDAQAHAVAEVEPARLGREVESEHALLSPFGGSGDGLGLRGDLPCNRCEPAGSDVGYCGPQSLTSATGPEADPSATAASIRPAGKKDTTHGTLVASGFTPAEGQQGSVGSRYVLLANRPRPEGTSQCQRS